jgi:hypothetical protein
VVCANCHRIIHRKGTPDRFADFVDLFKESQFRVTPRPNDAELERAKRLANRQMFTIQLQIRRIRSKEPEDAVFIFRWWADLQFLIVALWRMRQAALIAKDEPSVAKAIGSFDQGLPGLKVLRDVAEHIDAYALDSPKRHRKDKERRMLEVGSWEDPTYQWMGETLNVEEALSHAGNLFVSIRDALKDR